MNFFGKTCKKYETFFKNVTKIINNLHEDFLYICDNISMDSWNENCFRQTLYRKKQAIYL